MTTGEQLSIDRARLDRLVTALALASSDSFEAAMGVLGGPHEDDLGIVEEAMRLFFSELAEAKQRAAEALAALKASTRELEQKLETIELQQATIGQLSTPIIDIWRGILALPLLGSLGAERATEVTSALLERVVERRARWVLIDLTGVDAVDAATADHLLRLVRALELVGARCILSGIAPRLVGSLMTSGDALRGVRSMRTLQEALEYCLSRGL
jgi:rsbT co-antagonist protein RsbR